MQQDIPRILICRCALRSEVIPPQTRNWLDKFSVDKCVFIVDDLCGLAAAKDERLSAFCQQEKPVVVACHPRAIRSLFDAAGCILPDSTIFINAREETLQNVQQALQEEMVCEEGTSPGLSVSHTGNWVPWFPVIDYNRCTNCKQCLNFCLFGTYDQDSEGKVQVKEPSACKINCPACARICPSVAIIFPKYEESPINGGEIRDEEQQSKRVKVDTQKILGSDVYAALRQRQQKRQLLSQQTRNEQMEKARLEREECLRKKSEKDQ